MVIFPRSLKKSFFSRPKSTLQTTSSGRWTPSWSSPTSRGRRSSSSTLTFTTLRSPSSSAKGWYIFNYIYDIYCQWWERYCGGLPITTPVSFDGRASFTNVKAWRLKKDGCWILSDIWIFDRKSEPPPPLSRSCAACCEPSTHLDPLFILFWSSVFVFVFVYIISRE